jgi:hypothetical protein
MNIAPEAEKSTPQIAETARTMLRNSSDAIDLPRNRWS